MKCAGGATEFSFSRRTLTPPSGILYLSLLNRLQSVPKRLCAQVLRHLYLNYIRPMCANIPLPPFSSYWLNGPLFVTLLLQLRELWCSAGFDPWVSCLSRQMIAYYLTWYVLKTDSLLVFSLTAISKSRHGCAKMPFNSQNVPNCPGGESLPALQNLFSACSWTCVDRRCSELNTS